MKDLIVFLAAYPLCNFSIFKSYKNFLLSTWHQPQKRRGLDNFLYRLVTAYWFKHEYLVSRDPEQRENLKTLLMGGDSGKQWAQEYDSGIDFNRRIGRLTYKEACPLLPKLEVFLKSSAPGRIVIQLGCSSGKEIAWLAQRLPQHIFIGTDIYPSVIEYAAGHHAHPNLSYEVCAAQSIVALLERFKNKEIVIFSSSSLQYVQPEHIEHLFKILFSFQVTVMLLEPVVAKDGLPLLNGSSWRGNFSYTHNYKYYAEKAGFITEECDIIRPFTPYEDFPQHRHTAHYFYWCHK